MKENTSILTDLRQSVELITSSMIDNSMPLKDAKADLTMVQVRLHALNPSFDNGVLSLSELTLKGRTKKNMESDCRAVVAHWGGISAEEQQVDSSVGEGLAKFVELNNQPGEDDEDQPTSYLEELEVEIKYELESAQRSFLKVGECLTSANEEIKNGGGKMADFLTWANEKCGIKKAQAYKLMGVFKTFGTESDFNGVSMRVLYTLTGQCNEVVDAARAKAKDGLLDTKALDAIIMTVTGPKAPPEPKEKKEPATPKAPETPSTPSTPALADDAKDKEIEELKAQVKREKQMREDAVDAALDAASAGHDEDNNPSLLKTMQATIDELNATVAALTDELKASKEAPVNASSAPSPAAMPHLPQFESNSMPCRLGLEMEFCEDKIKINKAYRALAKFYTAATNPEAAALLKEARERLLKSAK